MSWSYNIDNFVYEWEGGYVPATPSRYDSGGEPPEYPELMAYALVSFYKDGQKILEVEVGEGWFNDSPDTDAYDEQRALEGVCEDVLVGLQDIDDGNAYPEDTYESMVKDTFFSKSVYVERVAMKTADAASKSTSSLFKIWKSRLDKKAKADWRAEWKKYKKSKEKSTAKYKQQQLEKSGFKFDNESGKWCKLDPKKGVVTVALDNGADGIEIRNYDADKGINFKEGLQSMSCFASIDDAMKAVRSPSLAEWLDKEDIIQAIREDAVDGGEDPDEAVGRFASEHDKELNASGKMTDEQVSEDAVKGDGDVTDDENGQDEAAEEQDGTSAEAQEGAKQCKGKTTSGEQCKNWTLNENGYCEWHQDQAGGKKSARSIEAEMMRMVAECMPKHAKSAAVSEGDKFTLYDNETYTVEEVDGDAVWVRGDQGDYTNWSVDDVDDMLDRGILEKVAGGMVKKSRCQYINKEGKRCNRMVKNAAYCSQHAKLLGKTAGSANCLVQLWNIDGSLYDEGVYSYGSDMADWQWWLNNIPNMDYVDRITFKNHSTEALQGELTIDDDMNAYYNGQSVGVAHEAAKTADDFGYTPYSDNNYWDDEVSEILERGGKSYDLFMERNGDMWSYEVTDWHGNVPVAWGEHESPELIIRDLADNGFKVAAKTADNYATAPRVPDEIDIDADNVDACPLCGDPNFDGSFCNVCGYEEPPEGFNDIDLESPADYEIYENDFEEDEESEGKPTFDPDEIKLDSEVEDKADELADNAPEDEDEYGVQDDDMAFA